MTWIGLGADEVVVGKLQPHQRLANIARAPRVSISMEAEGNQHGMPNYLVVEGIAPVNGGRPPSSCRRSATSARAGSSHRRPIHPRAS